MHTTAEASRCLTLGRASLALELFREGRHFMPARHAHLRGEGVFLPRLAIKRAEAASSPPTSLTMKKFWTGGSEL